MRRRGGSWHQGLPQKNAVLSGWLTTHTHCSTLPQRNATLSDNTSYCIQVQIQGRISCNVNCIILVFTTQTLRQKLVPQRSKMNFIFLPVCCSDRATQTHSFVCYFQSERGLNLIAPNNLVSCVHINVVTVRRYLQMPHTL